MQTLKTTTLAVATFMVSSFAENAFAEPFFYAPVAPVSHYSSPVGYAPQFAPDDCYRFPATHSPMIYDDYFGNGYNTSSDWYRNDPVYTAPYSAPVFRRSYPANNGWQNYNGTSYQAPARTVPQPNPFYTDPASALPAPENVGYGGGNVITPVQYRPVQYTPANRRPDVPATPAASPFYP